MKHLVLVLTIVVCLLGCNERHPIKTGLEGSKLPQFSFLAIDSVTNILTDSVPDGKATVLFYYSPFCPYCKAEMNQIFENMGEMKGIKFFLITDFPLSAMKIFYQEYRLKDYANVQAGYDSTYSFAKYFGANVVPFTAVYGKDKKLKGVYVGMTDVKSILALSIL